MIPSFEHIADLTPLENGRLEYLPAYILIKWAHHSALSGQITFQRDKRMKRVVWESGEILRIQSNLISEEFIPLVSRYNILTPAQKSKITSIDAQRDIEKPLTPADLGLDTLQTQKLSSVQFMEQFIDLCGWFSGDYAIEYKKTSSKDMGDFTPPETSFLLDKLENFILFGSAPLLPVELIDLSINVPVSIRSFSMPQIYSYLSAYKFSGSITLSREKMLRKIEFKNGKIISVQSTDAHQTLEHLVDRYNVIPKHELDELIRIKKMDSTAKLRDLLQDKHGVASKKIREMLLILHAERILECLSWRSGECRFKGQFKRKAKYTSVDEKTEFKSVLSAPVSRLAQLDVASVDIATAIPVVISFVESAQLNKKVDSLAHRLVPDHAGNELQRTIYWYQAELKPEQSHHTIPLKNDLSLSIFDLNPQTYFQFDKITSQKPDLIITPLVSKLGNLPTHHQFFMVLPTHIEDRDLEGIKNECDALGIKLEGFFTL